MENDETAVLVIFVLACDMCGTLWFYTSQASSDGAQP